jgi:hypothetical protein
VPSPSERYIAAFFFPEKAVEGKGLSDTAPDQTLGCQIGFCHPVENAFRPDIQILTPAIRQGQLPCLDSQLLGKDAPVNAIDNHEKKLPTTRVSSNPGWAA